MTAWTRVSGPDSAAVPVLRPVRSHHGEHGPPVRALGDAARDRPSGDDHGRDDDRADGADLASVTALPATAGRAGTTARRLDDVVRTHLPGLLRYATVLTGDGHTAADLVQEVLLRAHVRWARIALMDRPDLYLRRMVTNEHLSWRRRWHVRTVRPADDEVLAAHTDPQRDHAHHVVEDDAMWRLLAGLPPRQRTVLVLRYYEGLDDAEIGSVLATTPATVRSHASRALATLRRTDLTTSPETS